MRKALSAGMLGLMSAMLLLPAAPARAGLLDSLFGGASSGGESAKGDARRRTWTLHEFTTIRLVPRESGASPNQHPVQVEPETLRQQLTQVRFESRQGGQALFAADELGELTEPLAQALSNAGPDDDVLLLSTSRRGASLLEQPLGVTARLFVQGGALQVIVNDVRLEFMNNYLGSRRPPEFTFGSRNRPSQANLRSPSAKTVRQDWLALPLTASAAPMAPAAAAVAAPPAVAPAVPVAPAVAPVARPRDPGFSDDIEQRLLTLKRLRERGLISEEEYQQKRKEILSLL